MKAKDRVAYIGQDSELRRGWQGTIEKVGKGWAYVSFADHSHPDAWWQCREDELEPVLAAAPTEEKP